jgi:hypothetical protein
MTKEQFLKKWRSFTPAVNRRFERDLEDILWREWRDGFSEGLKKAEEAVTLGRKLASHFKPRQGTGEV